MMVMRCRGKWEKGEKEWCVYRIFFGFHEGRCLDGFFFWFFFGGGFYVFGYLLFESIYIDIYLDPWSKISKDAHKEDEKILHTSLSFPFPLLYTFRQKHPTNVHGRIID